MSSSCECDVLVVGGGPVGLLSGYILRRFYDVSVIVIEKCITREGYSRAFGMTPRTLEIFDSIDGLGDQIRCLSSKVDTFCHVFPNRAHVWPGFFVEVPGMRETVQLLAQSTQEEICLERFRNAGGLYHVGMEYVSLKQQENGVVTKCTDTQQGTAVEIKSKYVIGADGAHSLVRKQLGLSFDGYTDKSIMWLADIKTEKHTGGVFRIFHSPTGPTMQMAIGDHLLRMVCGWSDQESCPHDTTKPPTPQLMAEEINRRGGGQFEEKDFVWCNRLVVNFRIASKYRVGNVFLVGDAAHVHSPAGGQGLNTGYQDAVNLAWKMGSVLRHGLSPTVLDTYQAERAPIAEDTLKMTAQSRRMFNSRSPLQVLLWSWCLGVLKPCWWPLRLKFIRAVYQATLRPQDAFGGWDMWRGKDLKWSKCNATIGCRFPNMLMRTNNSEEPQWLSTIKPFDKGMWIYIDGVGQESTDDQAFSQMVCKLRPPEPFQSLPTALLRVTFCEWTEAFAKNQHVVVPSDILLARELCVGNDSSALYYIRPDGLVALRSRPASVYLERFRAVH